jgi:acyl transferase domain-containing protein/nucleoside-diphosphate-sugar epimerase/acyl carrier protein
VLFCADEGSRAHWLELLRPYYADIQASPDLHEPRPNQPLTVVFVGTDGAVEERETWASFQATSQALWEAIQWSLRPSIEQLEAFVLVTFRAHDVGDGSPAARELLEAPLWQLISSSRREHPSLNARCLDLAERPQSAADLRGVLSPDTLPDLVLRNGAYYCQTLLESALPSRPVAPDAFAQGSYLVTGASGDIGGSLVAWLAEHGARRVVMLSRGGMSSAAIAALVEAHPRLELSSQCVDITCADALGQAFAELALARHVVRGIFHLAAHVDDAMLTRQEWANARHVLAPKALGAWNLHCLSRGLPIEHFVLFSSACTFLGSTGQAAYALANEFLNQLAIQRVRDGLPALSVAWGAWDGTRTVSNPSVRTNLALAGIKARPAGAALADLMSLMLQPEPCVGSFDVDWSKFVACLSEREQREPYFASFAASLGPRRTAPSSERDVRATVVACLSDVLGVTAETLNKTQRTLFQLGMDSITAVELRDRLNRELGANLPVGFAYSYKTLEEIVTYLGSRSGSRSGSKPEPSRQPTTGNQDDIAVIGLSCRFPGAIRTPDEFWSSLWNGESSIERIERSHWLADLEDFPDVPDEIRFAGLIRGYAEFDPEFFQISPREAKYIDPQHRLLLLAAWEALESGNHADNRVSRERAGIFVGTGSNEFGQLLSRRPRDIGAHFGTGNAPSILAGRIAYFLDWHGPAITIDTACSSALVAIHQACQAIQRGECTLALAGGVNLQLIPATSLFLAKIEALSKTGRCRAFSADADGYVRAEGCGMVLLKPLHQALADGDYIHAVVCGGSINQDGRTQGITAPNGKAQASVIEAALRSAGREPAHVSYVEAHGTGTPLGDPIEMESINQVYGRQRSKHRPLRVGSVKANIGHTESAAGIASVIKVALMLEHQAIPRQLYAGKLNERLNLLNEAGDQVILVPEQSEPWQAAEGERLAGVSSFGFSGTNVHLLLREAPPRASHEAPPPDAGRHTFVLSARSDSALRSLAAKYARHLADRPQYSILDVCRTAAGFRSHFERRLALTCRDTSDLVAQLETFVSTNGAPERLQTETASPLLVLAGTLAGPTLTRYLTRLSAVPRLQLASEAAAQQILSLSLADLELRLRSNTAVPAETGDVLLLVLIQFLQRSVGNVAILTDCAPDLLLCGDDSPAQLAASSALRELRESLRAHSMPLTMLRRQALDLERSVLLLFEGAASLPAAHGQIDCSGLESLRELSGQLYRSGFDVDFSMFLDGLGGRKVVLPTYAFDQRSYLPEQLQESRGTWDWMKTPEPSTQGALAFSTEFDAHTPYPLNHHVLHGRVVVPGAFYLSLVCEIARRRFHAQRLALIDVTFSQAQVLEEHGRYELRFVLRETRSQIYDVDIQTRILGANAWQLTAHLTLSLNPGSASRPDVEWPHRPPTLAVQDFYQTLSGNGSKLGRAFQCIRSIRHANQIAFCELEAADDRDLGVSPGLFDSFFQTMGLCLPGAEQDWAEVRVPYSIGRIQIDATDLSSCRVRTSLQRLITSDEGQKVLVHDIQVFDRGQRPLLLIEDFATLSYAHSAAAERKTSLAHAYTWQWQAAELPRVDIPRRPARPLVYCPAAFNAAAWSRDLSIELERSGGTCSSSLADSFEALRRSQAEGGEELVFWLLYTLPHERYDAALFERLAHELFVLKQAILSHPGSLRTTFNFASHRSLCAERGETVENLVGHVLLGFLKTMSVECQRPSWAWHDWPDTDARESARRIQQRLAVGDERLLAHRATKVFVPRLTRHRLQAPWTFASTGGTYVISGATGGVARALVAALRDRGVKHFVLLSRSIREDGLADLLSQDQGFTVLRRALDISEAAGLNELLADVERSMPPIAAIFHTAGALRDGGMEAQSEHAFQEVLSAKALGAWNLHEATATRPHIRLVLLSSAGAVFGAVGQGLYAGANQFLHGLTALRAAHRLPTTCIASGGWAGIGMQSAQSGVAQKSGLANLSSEEMIESIFGCMSSDESDFAVMNVDWERLGVLFAQRSLVPAEFSLLLQMGATHGAENASRVQAVLEIPKSARIAHVTKLLADAIAPLLELDSAKLASGKSLRSLGLDSITALQIRQLVNLRFELQAPATVLFEVTNLRDLAAYVCDEIEKNGRPAQTDAPPTIANEARLETTNEEDLLAILSDLVGT